jgi:hypothetical protein
MPSGTFQQSALNSLFLMAIPQLLSPVVFLKKGITGQREKLPVLHRITLLLLSETAEETAIFLLTCCQL